MFKTKGKTINKMIDKCGKGDLKAGALMFVETCAYIGQKILSIQYIMNTYGLQVMVETVLRRISFLRVMPAMMQRKICFFGKLVQGVLRSTFLIVDGKVVRIWKVDRVKGHAAEVLAAAQAL